MPGLVPGIPLFQSALESVASIIKGLLARLPKSGDVWPEADRVLWLELLKGSFKLIYRDKLEPGQSPPRRRGLDAEEAEEGGDWQTT